MRKIVRLSIVLGCMAALLNAGELTASAAASYQQTGFAMDTVVSEKIYTDGEDITGEVLQLLEEAEQTYLSWTSEASETFRINEAGENPTAVSEEMAGWLEQILKLSESSKGAFDPTLGKVIRLWDIGGENQQIPSAAELDDLLDHVGWEKIFLDGNQVSLLEDACLDLGAVGKGIGCDVINAYLERIPEVTGAMINLGGSSVLTYGKKPDGSDWKIAVMDPRDPDGEYMGVISMGAGEFLSTSGDYKKYFEEDGVRYHHIFDPSTGYPARSGLSAVTVICENGLDADGLSTACFVLGREKGAELLKLYGADGLFVDGEHHFYMTEGMRSRFQLQKTSYSEMSF